MGLSLDIVGYLVCVCLVPTGCMRYQTTEQPDLYNASEYYYDYYDYLEDPAYSVTPFITSRLTPEERLLRDLFEDYDVNARAVLDSSNTVTVNIRYTLLRIQKLDVRAQVLHTTGLLITEWADERLSWNPERYAGLTDVVVPPAQVWIPELTLMNGAEDMNQDFGKMQVIISSQGHIHWEPGGIFSTTCDLDITFFPFDFQKCSIIVGTWAYYSRRMNLTSNSLTISLSDYTESGEWDILKTEVHWQDYIFHDPNIRYPFVTSTLYMKRRVQYYLVNIVLPCIILSVLILVVFCIPPEAGEKISCGISLMIAFTVFLLSVSHTIPRTSLQLPLIVMYLTFTMVLAATSLCLAILSLNTHYRRDPIPKWVKVIVMENIAKVLRMNLNAPVKYIRRKKTKENNNFNEDCSSDYLEGACAFPVEEDSENSTTSREDPDNYEVWQLAEPVKVVPPKKDKYVLIKVVCYEWKDVARVLDRLFFTIVGGITAAASALVLLSPFLSSAMAFRK